MQKPITFLAALLTLSACVLSNQMSLAQRANIAAFTSPIQRVANAEAFEAFVENHRGKIVHINVEAGLLFSAIGNTSHGETDFYVSTEACRASNPAAECAGSHYMLSGNGYTLRYYADKNLLIGYFLIDEDVQMHQGRYYVLKAIPAEQVLLKQ